MSHRPQDSEAAVAVLRGVDLLDGVDDATLARLYEAGRVLSVAPDEYLVRQGEYGDSLFVVLRGRARMQLVGDDGRMRDVSELGPGQYIGELCLLGGGERGASILARTQLDVLEVRQGPFQSVTKKFKKVATRVELAYTRRALQTFFRQSRYFRSLPDPIRGELIAASALESFAKGDQIIAEGGPAQRFYIVRSGFVRVSRKVKGAGSDEILAYLGVEDFFGDQELAAAADSYAATVTALEPVETIGVPRAVFWRLYKQHPEIFEEFRRYQISRAEQQSVLAASKTSMAFVKDVLESGLGQARSALIIHMDACVRCGNCVQACDDLHGYSRLARRGKRMTRRVEQESRKHENLFFPTSCLQCATPECMVGCPTGAISRDPGGEVFIRDTCIGCGACARNCEFGNISMARVRPEGEFSLLGSVLGRSAAPPAETMIGKIHSDLLAVKCDVCFERSHAACVYNCPTQAISRIDPRTYFHELAQIAPRAGQLDAQPGAAKTARARTRVHRWLDATLQLWAAAVAVAGGYALWLRTTPTGWTGIGWYAGIAAASMMVLLGLMGVRKRLRTARIGSLSAWARAHGVFGGLFYGVVLFHAGYQATSVLTATLLATVTIVVLTGALGQLANLIVPRLISRTEDESLLPEDVVPRIRDLSRENEELLVTLESRMRRRVERHVRRLSRGTIDLFVRGVTPKQFPRLLEKRSRNLPALDEAENALALRIAQNRLAIHLFRLQRGLEHIMTTWVHVHMVASCAAVLLLLGHLMTVLLW